MNLLDALSRWLLFHFINASPRQSFQQFVDKEEFSRAALSCRFVNEANQSWLSRASWCGCRPVLSPERRAIADCAAAPINGK